MPRRMRSPATMSVAIEVRSEVRERSSCWRRCSGRSSGSAAPTRTGAATRVSSPSCHDMVSTMKATVRYDASWPRRAREDLAERTELVGVARGDAEDLAGRRPAGQHVAHLRHLAGDHLQGAVERDQPAAHHERVRHDAEDTADHDHEEQRGRPAGEGRLGPADDALVDRSAEDPRPERHRQEPQRVAEGREGDQGLLLPEDPAEERQRRAGVGVRRGCGVRARVERRDPRWVVLHLVSNPRRRHLAGTNR